MLALAQRRATTHGWNNVVLIHSPVAQAVLPMAHHTLFCAVHDVLQSAPALDHVLEHVQHGGTVAAAGAMGPTMEIGPQRMRSGNAFGPTSHPSLGSDSPGRYSRIASPTWS